MLLVPRVRGRSFSVVLRFNRRLLLLITIAASGAAAAFALPQAQDRVLYNHTPSVPVGLYVRTNAPLTRGVFVTVRAVDVAPREARARGFDGPRDRFIKRVAAIGGDHVCGIGSAVLINGVEAAARLTPDERGAALPTWEGCRVLAANEVLLLGETERSFDGRYWGPVGIAQIEGVWRPFMTSQLSGTSGP